MDRNIVGTKNVISLRPLGLKGIMLKKLCEDNA